MRGWKKSVMLHFYRHHNAVSWWQFGQLHFSVHCFHVPTCQTQTPLQHQKTKARCADRGAWPPPRPTRATATQPLSTGLIASSRVRRPHRPRHPPRPTREEGPSQTRPHTQLWMPTPPLPLLLTWWHTPSSVSNPQELPHVTFLSD